MSQSNVEAKDFPLDISDLCNLLQCLGYNITNTKKVPIKKTESGKKIIDIICNIAGVRVTLESTNDECNCPEWEEIDDNEKWEVSGTSRGQLFSQIENDSIFQRNLSKNIISHVQSEIQNLTTFLQSKTLLLSPSKRKVTKSTSNLSQKNADINFTNNFSMSSSCLLSPPNMAKHIKISTPSRYRSLDTLNDTDVKLSALPEPRVLSGSQKSIIKDSTQEIDTKSKNIKPIVRQNTYTTSPSESLRINQNLLPSRTSSPISAMPSIAMLNLHQAEKITEDLMVLIQETIKSLEHENKSNSSLVLNVSKITGSKSQAKDSLTRSESVLSSKSATPYRLNSPYLNSPKGVPQITFNTSKRRLSYKSSPVVAKTEVKTNSLKRSIPKKFSSIKSISPTFGVVGNKKNLGLGSVLGKQVVGSYKSLTEKTNFPSTGSIPTRQSFRSTIAKSENDLDVKKKNNLYSHIKSTIPRQVSSAKK